MQKWRLTFSKTGLLLFPRNHRFKAPDTLIEVGHSRPCTSWRCSSSTNWSNWSCWSLSTHSTQPSFGASFIYSSSWRFGSFSTRQVQTERMIETTENESPHSPCKRKTFTFRSVPQSTLSKNQPLWRQFLPPGCLSEGNNDRPTAQVVSYAAGKKRYFALLET